MDLQTLMIAAGVPSGIFGFFIWWLKRDIERREKAREKREKNIEELIMLSLQTSRSTCVLAVATAKAVQRIPDAKCNGDMKEALESAAKLQGLEKNFLIENGVKHIFGE